MAVSVYSILSTSQSDNRYLYVVDDKGRRFSYQTNTPEYPADPVPCVTRTDSPVSENLIDLWRMILFSYSPIHRHPRRAWVKTYHSGGSAPWVKVSWHPTAWSLKDLGYAASLACIYETLLTCTHVPMRSLLSIPVDDLPEYELLWDQQLVSNLQGRLVKQYTGK